MADYGQDSRTEQAFDTKNTVRTDKPIAPKVRKPDAEESLLEMEESEAAKRMLKDWDKSWKSIKRFLEQWKVNRARSEGFTGVQLVKKQDQLQAYIPTGAKKNIAGMNKASRLSRRIRSTLFSDPPKPECLPSTDSDEDRDGAEVSTRVLEDLCSEGNLAFNLHAGDAFDLGGDYGSGFIRFWVDETGGGWRPKEIQASPQAVSAADPFPIDPQTGKPRPCDPINRFVTESGAFTEDRTQAERVWLPRIKDEVLTGKQVRFLPPDVRDLWEADGAQVGTAVMLGELETTFPEIKDWSEDRRLKLLQFRPQHFKDLLAPGQKDNIPSGSEAKDGFVFVLTRYHVQSVLYPQGAYLIAAGEDEILHRSEWFDQEHGEPLDIPLTQFKQRTEEGNPYGEGNMTALGPGNELRSGMVGAMLEHLDRFQSRLIFLPMTSTLQPQQLQTPTGTVQYILPGGEPKYEEIPDFPLVVKETLQFASQDMDDEADLQQAGQGVNPQGVKSAKHQEVILQQVTQAMSDLRQNTERGLSRGWRIMLQLVRAYFTVPQEVSWLGDDGRYKVKHWTAQDLGSTKDVRVAKGSFTQLTPMSKAQLANVYRTEGLLNPMEAEHVIESNLGGVFGLQDNPHRMRVRRQIAQWNEGPPEGWNPPAPPMMVPGAPAGTPGQLGAPALPPGMPAPPAGAGAPPAPPPPDPVLSVIFGPVPADDEPQVAALRMYELGRAMAGTKFHKWPEAWQKGLAESYALARKAAQIPDAKLLQGMQQELEQTKQQLLEAKVKAGEAHVSFAGKLADLDENQTMALLQKEGIQVPPRATPLPQPLDPKTELEHQTALSTAQMVADTEKHKATEQANVERERIRSVAQNEKLARDHKHQLDMLDRTKAKKHTVTKGKDGTFTVEST